jgi:Mn-dependent DtxR family transcriptional regulator
MNPSADTKSLAAHVLVALVRAQRARQVVTVHDVAIELDVRKTDVRDVVARLHHEGHVDALRMKLTLSGLTLATALSRASLRPLRSSELADSAAA